MPTHKLLQDLFDSGKSKQHALVVKVLDNVPGRGLINFINILITIFPKNILAISHIDIVDKWYNLIEYVCYCVRGATLIPFT